MTGPEVDVLTAVKALTTLLEEAQAHNVRLAATRRHLVRQARRQGYTLAQIGAAAGLDFTTVSRLAREPGRDER